MANEWGKTLFFVVCIVIAALIFILSQGCASQEHRREALQKEHPDCFVFHDLRIECPNPFDLEAKPQDVRVITTPLIIEQPKPKKKRKQDKRP